MNSEKNVTTAMKISLFFIFIFSCINSTRAYSAVTGASIISWITIVANALNPIIEMGVGLATIAMTITTIMIARKKLKQMDKDAKDDD